ncbi:aminoacyl-tRNA deacylase [Nocardioides sp. Arc9.136]|uniref:aminoacyl-tRNA deacylase n=1 Tax=Nocardioides sp. Arc9.136 TaxID=2996826 RepID=UPI002665E0CA|nr:YbaK/EbsC family protein [Nocardioides sp. Arc9.136]WKN50523.1 YbaK/EbsC family protein [Nocardioides sp. Arc9.136]
MSEDQQLTGAERVAAAARRLGLEHEVVRHGPAASLAEAAVARGVEPRQLVKTMVVRVSAGDHRFLLVPGDRQISWPRLRALLAVNRLTMASADEAFEVTGYRRGTITPLGSRTALPVIADTRVRGRISVGAGEPGAGLSVDADDLVAAVGAQVADVTEPAGDGA